MKIKKTGNIFTLMSDAGAPVECFDTKKEAQKNFHKYCRKDMLREIDRFHSWESLWDCEHIRNN